MPLAPTPAQAQASRRNGALSRGPRTAEGKARSAGNGTAHGLAARGFAPLPGEDPAEHAALLAAYLARHAPIDAAERFWVEQIVFALWRLRRLEAVEAAALARAMPGAGTAADEEDELRPPPSLDTLLRYRARIERDHKAALAELERLQAARPRLPAALEAAAPSAARLRWLLARAEERAARIGNGTSEPEPSAPIPPPCGDERPPGLAGGGASRQA